MDVQLNITTGHCILPHTFKDSSKSFEILFRHLGAKALEMQPYMSITQARELIAIGKTEQAFELLIRSISELPPEYSDDIRLLNTQFHIVSRQLVMGLEHEQTQLNKVIYGLLQVLSAIEKEKTTITDKSIEKAAINTKAFLLFEFHQESIRKFKIVYQQLSEFFSKADIEDTLIPISNYIDDLLLLREKIGMLEDELDKSQAKFRHAELITLANQKKDYIQESMPITDINTQIQAIDQLQKQFKNSSLKELLAWGLGILIIIAIIVIIGLLFKDI